MAREIVLFVAAPDSVPVIRCSPPSWAAQIALLEEDVPHEVRALRFDRGEHRTEAMLALHPAGTLPLLLDGETAIDDTVAILEHVVRRSGAKRLAPDPAVAAQRLAAARAVKDAGMQAFRAMMKGADAPWGSLRGALDAWEHGGFDSRLDVASLLVFVYVVTARSLGLETGAWPRLERFVTDVRSRPSVASCWAPTLG